MLGVGAQTKNLAVAVKSHFGGHDLISTVRVAEKGFGSSSDPFDRAPDAARSPHHQCFFRVAAGFHPEATADIRRYHPQPRFRNFEDPRERAAVSVWVLGCRIQRKAIVITVIFCQRRPWLDRVGRDSIVRDLQCDNVVGLRESRVGFLFVTEGQNKRHVTRAFVPNRGGVRLRRVLDRDHGRQDFVIDTHQLGGVPRLQRGLGDNKSEPVADGADLVTYEDRAEGPKALWPAHIFGHDRRQAFEPFRLHILRSQDTKNTGGPHGLIHIDCLDKRVSNLRHYQCAVALARQIDVVDVVSASHDESRILSTANWLADPEFICCHRRVDFPLPFMPQILVAIQALHQPSILEFEGKPDVAQTVACEFTG